MSPSDEVDDGTAAAARLFVALWPDDTVRARLAAFAASWRWPAGARRVAPPNLHLTLHYIGVFDRDRIDALAGRLADVPPRPIDLRPVGTELWRGGIAVLRFDADPALDTLHREVGGVLAGFGVALDDRPFRPHVTLARKAAGAVPPLLPSGLDGSAAGFALVESRPGPPARYERLAAWGDTAPWRPRGGAA